MATGTDEERGGGAAGGDTGGETGGTTGGGASGAIESATTAILYAIRRMGWVGGHISGDVDIGKLIEKFAETIKNGQTPAAELIKKAIKLVSDESKAIDKKSSAKTKQAKVLVTASLKRIKGLDLGEDVKNDLAEKLQSELVDNNLQELLDKPAKDLTATEIELIKTTVLKEVVEKELTDDQLETVFNAANDRMKEELGDTKDADGNIIAEQLPAEKIEKGSEEFKAMKESFKEDMAKFIVEPRAVEGGEKANVLPSGGNQAIMASRALFRNAPYFAGQVPTISLSDFSGNQVGATDFSSQADFSAINFGDGAKADESLGAGADQGVTALKIAELKTDKVVDNVKTAADKAATNRKIDAREESDLKQDNKEDAAEKKEANKEAEEKSEPKGLTS